MSFTTFFLCLSFFSFVLLKPFPSQCLLLLTNSVELMDCFGWTPTTECHLISVPLNRSYLQQNVIGSPLLLPPSSSVEASMNGEMKCACIIESIVSVSPSLPLSLHSSLPHVWWLQKGLAICHIYGWIKPMLASHDSTHTHANGPFTRPIKQQYKQKWYTIGGDFGEVWSTLVNFIDVCYDD